MGGVVQSGDGVIWGSSSINTNSPVAWKKLTLMHLERESFSPTLTHSSSTLLKYGGYTYEGCSDIGEKRVVLGGSRIGGEGW